MAANIRDYIKDAREKKISDEEIKSALLAANWPEDKVHQALAAPEPNSSLLPPPPVPNVGMWTGFLYVIFFPALYTLATSMATLFHSAVDKYMPNPATSTNFLSRFDSYTIKISLAALIVSYIIFIVLAFVLKKQMREQPHVRNFKFRKFMIYLTLVVTFLIVMCHLIGYVYALLDGSTTMNMFGHLLVTIVVAGSIFWYYLNDVKNDRK